MRGDAIKRFITATVFLFFAVQLQAAFAQSAVYDIDISGIGDENGIMLRVFGLLDVNLETDQVNDSEIQFQVGDDDPFALDFTFNTDAGAGFVDFVDRDGDLFVITELNTADRFGPQWETFDSQTRFEIFTDLGEAGILLDTFLSGGERLAIDAPGPDGFRLGQLAVPEPSSVAFLVTGFISICARRRRAV